jgi:hypothetical protein
MIFRRVSRKDAKGGRKVAKKPIRRRGQLTEVIDDTDDATADDPGVSRIGAKEDAKKTKRTFNSGY